MRTARPTGSGFPACAAAMDAAVSNTVRSPLLHLYVVQSGRPWPEGREERATRLCTRGGVPTRATAGRLPRRPPSRHQLTARERLSRWTHPAGGGRYFVQTPGLRRVGSVVIAGG